jgi:polyhydroxybutyrate depolymerase
MYNATRNLSLLLILVQSFTGCTATTSPNENEEEETLHSRIYKHTITQTDGQETVERHFTVQTPIEWDTASPLPLLFAFHGGGGEGHFFVEDFDELMQTGRFIGVYPEGIEQSWNLGFEESTADDITFVLSILETLEGTTGMETRNPVAMGYSNGAGLVHRLAVETDRFVSIGAMASQLMLDNQPQIGDAHVSVLQLHGTEDDVISYNGSVGEMEHQFLPAEESASVWAAHNGCRETASESSSGSYIRMEWAQCSTNTRVVHYRLNGIGHDMPWDVEGGTEMMIIDFLLSTRPEL